MKEDEIDRVHFWFIEKSRLKLTQAYVLITNLLRQVVLYHEQFEKTGRRDKPLIKEKLIPMSLTI